MFLIVLFSFLVLNSAQASGKCDVHVYLEYEKYIQTNTANTFENIERISFDQAKEAIQESVELNEKQKASGLKAIKKPKVLLYAGASNYMGGTGLEILIVNPSSCKITKKIFFYAE